MNNIPKGYKLVPVEPTEEMLVVMHDRILIGVNSKKREANILNDKAWWAAVVDSASTPPQPFHSALNFVCTALPGPGNECAFVELENEAGESLGHGEWRNREDGLFELHIAAPKVIFDETKERQLFETQFVREQQRLGKYYTDLTVEHKWRGWLACAQSRAKAGEVGHE